MRKSKFFAILLVFFILAGFFGIRFLSERYTVPVLMYHSVSEREDLGSLSVDPSIFTEQIAYLHKNDYNVISLKDLVDGINNEKDFPRGTVVITFDDGFKDNFTNAFPIINKYEFSAKIFLITSKVGEDPEYLNWEQIKIMQQHNISFGSHTHNHVYLPRVSDKEVLWEEISLPRDIILSETGKEPLFFCYPVGGFSEEIKDLVKAAGYEGACATNRGYDPLNKDVYEINRIKITDSDMTRPMNFRIKLSGFYNLFRSRRSPN